VGAQRQALSPLALGLLFALACAPFLPALGNEFVDWDDRQNFVDNPHYRGFAPANLAWMFSAIHLGHYMPLTWLSSALDYTLFGMNPVGYHLTNLLLHGLVAVLLAQLIAELLERAAPSVSARARGQCAFAGALLYAVHPLRVESVAWATERRDVLSGALLLLSILAYVRERRTLSLVSFALSLLSKTSGMVLPLLLFGLDVYPLRRAAGWRARVEDKLPWIAMGALAAWVAWLGQARTQGAFTELGLGQRLAVSANALVFYPWKTLWPTGLAPLYPLELAPAAADPRTLVNVLLLVGVSAAALLLRRRRPLATAAWLAYLVLIAPVSGLAHAGRHFAADRYTYLAALPAAWLAAGLLLGARERRWAFPAALALAAVLGTLSWRQTLVWRDSVTLWTRVAEVSPGSSVGPHRLGVALREAGRDDEALAAFERALALPPPAGADDARYDLAEVQYALGRSAAALESIGLALERRPDQLDALLLAEEIHVRAGQPDRAAMLYVHAVEAVPDFHEGHARLSQLHRAAGRLHQALAEGQLALDLAPDSDLAHAVLGLALFDAGDFARAEGHLRIAVLASPENADLLAALGTCLERLGRADEAELVRRRLARLSGNG